MQTIINLSALEPVDAIAKCRQAVTRDASALLHSPRDIPFVEQYDALPKVSSLLMTSLEELKVAEEELRMQNHRLEEQRSIVEEQLRHYRALFLHAPFPALITDSFATIRESNIAANMVFRREAQHLNGKPLAAMLPPDAREEFRRRLRLVTEDGVEDWRMVMNRRGDLPLRVSATVHHLPNGDDGRRGVLYWALRVLSPDD